MDFPASPLEAEYDLQLAIAADRDGRVVVADDGDGRASRVAVRIEGMAFENISGDI